MTNGTRVRCDVAVVGVDVMARDEITERSSIETADGMLGTSTTTRWTSSRRRRRMMRLLALLSKRSTTIAATVAL